MLMWCGGTSVQCSMGPVRRGNDLKDFHVEISGNKGKLSQQTLSYPSSMLSLQLVKPVVAQP